MVLLFVLFPASARVGIAAGRAGAHRPVGQHAAGRRRVDRRGRFGRAAPAFHGAAAAARADVLPRPGAVDLRWPRMDAAGAQRPGRATPSPGNRSEWHAAALRDDDRTQQAAAAAAAGAEPRRCRQRAGDPGLAADAAPPTRNGSRPAAGRTCAHRGQRLAAAPPRPAKRGARTARLVALPPAPTRATLQWARSCSGTDLPAPMRARSATPCCAHWQRRLHYTLEPGPYDRDARRRVLARSQARLLRTLASAFGVVMRALDVRHDRHRVTRAPMPSLRTVTDRAPRTPTPGPRSGRPASLDPHRSTPPWRPDRVQRGRSLSARGAGGGAFNSIDPALRHGCAVLGGCQQPLEPMGVNYSRGQQFDLCASWGSKRRAGDLAKMLTLLLCGAALAGAAGPGGTAAGRTPGSACSAACSSGWPHGCRSRAPACAARARAARAATAGQPRRGRRASSKHGPPALRRPRIIAPAAGGGAFCPRTQGDLRVT